MVNCFFSHIVFIPFFTILPPISADVCGHETSTQKLNNQLHKQECVVHKINIHVLDCAMIRCQVKSFEIGILFGTEEISK